MGFSGVGWPSGGWALSHVLGMCRQTRAEGRVRCKSSSGYKGMGEEIRAGEENCKEAASASTGYKV